MFKKALSDIIVKATEAPKFIGCVFLKNNY